jgi:hypothetical protein
LARSAACCLACALSACGPVGATSLINDAEVAVARAHAADGEKLAPYETTLADLYLTKAREEQGHAKYSDARELAADCIKQADLAARKSVEHRRAPPSAPAEPAAPAAPLLVPAPSKPLPATGEPATEASPPERKPAAPEPDPGPHQ